MGDVSLRFEAAMLLIGFSSNAAVAFLSRHSRAQAILGTLGTASILGAAGLLLWPVIGGSYWRVALYGVAGLSVLYVYSGLFRRFRKLEITKEEAEGRLQAMENAQLDAPASPESVERLREAWAACRPAFALAATWVRLIREIRGRELSAAERIIAELAAEHVAGPFEELCNRVSEAIASDRQLTACEFSDARGLFTRAIFRYCAVAANLLSVSFALGMDDLTQLERYGILYREHDKGRDELRRVSKRSDIGRDEFPAAVEAMRNALPAPGSINWRPQEDPYRWLPSLIRRLSRYPPSTP